MYHTWHGSDGGGRGWHTSRPFPGLSAGAAEILFARFREEDVKAGKIVSKDAALKNIVKSRQLCMSSGRAGGSINGIGSMPAKD